MNADYVIVGGGIVGLATAWTLHQRFPDAKLCLLEKEPEVGQHQSGRNSGVLHSGIYYKPGSLKATTTCRAGKKLMEQFCSEENIPYELCGKIIVALDEIEAERLDAIYQRGQANGVNCRKIDAHEIRELEPHSAGVAAIHVPNQVSSTTQLCVGGWPTSCERQGIKYC